MNRSRGWGRVAVAGSLLGAALMAGAATPAGPVAVSVALGGGNGDSTSTEGSPSGNGKLVVFSSQASDLVEEGHQGGTSGIFLRDMGRGTTRVLSVATKVHPDDPDVAANDDSYYPCISSNGKVVVFTSEATNLVPGDDEGRTDVFVAWPGTGIVRRISEAPDGTGGDDQSYCTGRSLSKNGRYVTFTSFATNLVPDQSTSGLGSNVFVHDLVKGTTVRLTDGGDDLGANAYTSDASISPNGKFVAFISSATNLEQGFGGNNEVYVADLRKGTLAMVSRVNGVQANNNCWQPVVSNNGKVVAFRSQANNLVPSDTNGYSDIFVADRKAGTMTRASVAPNGEQSNDHATSPALSPTGKFVIFETSASNLLPEATDFTDQIYLRDLKKGTLRILSATANGTPGDGDSALDSGSLSPDGKWLSFTSLANNLVPGGSGGSAGTYLVPTK